MQCYSKEFCPRSVHVLTRVAPWTVAEGSWRFASGINTTIGTGAVYPAGSQQHSALIKNSMQPDMDCMTDLNIDAVAEMLTTDDVGGRFLQSAEAYGLQHCSIYYTTLNDRVATLRCDNQYTMTWCVGWEQNDCNDFKSWSIRSLLQLLGQNDLTFDALAYKCMHGGDGNHANQCQCILQFLSLNCNCSIAVPHV